jgi:hypothetical protein
MLIELKRNRKETKKAMFAAQQSGDIDLYQKLDLEQLNDKIIMNADYGASGSPTAAFYTKYSPAATTLIAQSIITTMAAFFEGFVGDNQKFFQINECIDWMNAVCKKSDKIHKWIYRPTTQDVIKRIKNHFLYYDMNDDLTINHYIENCTSDELVYLYYVNNFKEFIKNHTNVIELIKNILITLPLYEASETDIPNKFKDKFNKVEDYNNWVSTEMFLNPYKIPKSIESYMNDLTDVICQYVFVEYLVPDSIIKLNNHKRNTVLLVDTDSNVINADIFVSLVTKELFPNTNFSRKSLYNDMICVNILAAILDRCISKIIDLYGRNHNIGPEGRKELVMKNEYMFRRFFLMNKKKRYAASIALREGNIMIPFNTEIKGVDFIKAGVSEDVTNKFTKMLENHILFSDELELHELMKELKEFEKEIYLDLKSGGVKYLKPQQYKAEGAYKKTKDAEGNEFSTAWSLPVFRSVAIWNEIYPTQRIYSLDRVKMIKLTVTKLEDLDMIKDKFSNEYKIINEKIFHSNNSEIVKAGLKVIALPSTLLQVPEWIIPLIDYNIIISDTISSFRSILEAFNIEEINFKTPNNKANITTSLISI